MAEPHTLMAGLVVGESPRWHEGRLWFSNWGAQEIIAVDVRRCCPSTISSAGTACLSPTPIWRAPGSAPVSQNSK
jgi:sugar lactone lactonase YvrE